MNRLSRAAGDLRAFEHPRSLARYFLLRANLATALETNSLRALPARLDAFSSGRIVCDADEVTRALPRLERWVSRARVLSDTCLYRAAGRYVVLRAAGLAPRLVVGAERDEARHAGLIGHAWVELGGVPFLEPEDPRARFRRTWSHPVGPEEPGVDAP